MSGRVSGKGLREGGREGGWEGMEGRRDRQREREEGKRGGRREEGWRRRGRRHSIYVVCSVQLASDSRAELNLEQMMDEYYSLHDNDTPQTGPFPLESSGEKERSKHDSTSPTSSRVHGNVGGTAARKQRKKAKEMDGMELVRAGTIQTRQCRKVEGAEGKGEGEEWRARNIDTVFGVSDDLVTLGDGKEYYFFKLPHKVRTVHLWQRS